jgi:hypothetical protein
MKTIQTILFAFLLCAVTAPKAQFIKEIAVGIGTNGLSASVNHSLGKKWLLGESFSVMNWKPSTFGSPFNRNGLAIMHLKFVQTGIFLRWHPFGKETIYGYQKTGLYLTGGVFYKFNDDWITTSAFYAKRKLRNEDTDSVYYQTGEIKLNTYTQRIQPFVGMGFRILGKDTKLSLQFEGGISFHGKPDGFVTSTNNIDITISDISRLEKLHRYLLGFPFFQLNLVYNNADIYKSAFTTKF